MRKLTPERIARNGRWNFGVNEDNIQLSGWVEEGQDSNSQFLVANSKFKGWPDIVQLRAYYIPKKGKP